MGGSNGAAEQSSEGWPPMNSGTPSNSDFTNLRRVADNLPRRVWVVALIGFWERFTFWGLTAPWQNYMTNDPWIDVRPGKLGLGQATATRIYCGFYIFYYVAPIFVAVLSDARLGRFKTLCFSAILFFLGSAILTITSHPWMLVRHAGLPGLIVAMMLIGLGGGGFRAIIVPFIADQYPKAPARLVVLKSGEHVVVDHTLTLGYIYTVYYWVGNIGSLSWFATTYMEKYYDEFWPAFALTCCSMAIAMLMLLFGGSWYVNVPQEGNVIPEAAKIVLCATKNGFNMKHAQPDYQLERHAKRVTWSSHLADEVRRALRACKVLTAFVVFYICFDQMQNNLISQAGQMETDWMPSDAMPALNQVAVIIFGPIIHYFYIVLHKRKIYLRPIARITIGFAFTSLSMAYATCVQGLIYRAPPCYKYPLVCDLKGIWPIPPNKLNVWIQAPVYVLLAIGEIFGLVTALEYSYGHSPKEMKAVIQAISLLIAGLGSACAMALTPIAKDPHLMTLYASLFAGMALITVVFWLVFRKYDRNYIFYGNEEIDIDADPGRDETLTENRGPSVLRVLPKTATSRPSRDNHDKDNLVSSQDGGSQGATAGTAFGTDYPYSRCRRSTRTDGDITVAIAPGEQLTTVVSLASDGSGSQPTSFTPTTHRLSCDVEAGTATRSSVNPFRDVARLSTASISTAQMSNALTTQIPRR